MRLLQSQIVILLMILTLTFSCIKPSPQNENQTESFTDKYSDTLPTVKENIIITKYKEYIKQLDKNDLNSISSGIEKYKTDFLNQNKSLCDTGFVVYQQLIDSIESYLNLKFQNDTTDYSSIWNGGPVSEKIKEIQNNLKQNGFKLSSAEGMVYIEQDRRFFIPVFEPYITEVMQKYLLQVATENEEGFASDAAISIPPQKHVDRIIWYENFVLENPDFVLSNNCKNYKKAYLSYLLSGFDNTPLFKENSTSVLTDYYTKAYNYLLKKYPESETANLVKPYYDAIKKNQSEIYNELYKNYVIKGLIFNMK